MNSTVSFRFFAGLVAFVSLALLPGVAVHPSAAAAQPPSPVSVHWQLTPAEAKPGGTIRVGVTLNHEGKWHSWPNTLAGDFQSFIPTTLELPDQPVWASDVGAIEWPATKMATVPSPTGFGTAQAPVFAGKATITVPLTIAEDATPGTYVYRPTIGFQSCDDKVCLPPTTSTLEIPITIAASNEVADEAAADDKLLRVTVTPQMGVATPGGAMALAVRIEPAPDWALWSGREVAIPEWVALPTPTEITVSGNAVAHVGEAQWPDPSAIAPPADLNLPGELAAFDQAVTVFLPVRLAGDLTPGEATTLSVTVSAEVFQDPDFGELATATQTLNLDVVEATAVTPTSESAVFDAFDPAALQVLPEVEVNSASSREPDASEAAAPQPQGLNLLGLKLPALLSAEGGLNPVALLVLTLAAGVGGFILNLTPCVLPVIPIKVMTLTSHAGESKQRAFVLGLWMSIGVVAFWAALGVPLAILVATTQNFVDPSQFIFGRWYVTLTIGFIIAVMALGLMGLFSINLPQKAYMVNPSADSAQGSFMFGVMTAILGLPCFGFVAGGLLAGAASMPWQAILAVFVGMGVGMAAPYLVLSVYPKLLSFVPKTGPASELVKQFMGLLLLAAAAFFIGAGVKGLVKTYPFVGETLDWWVVALFLAAAGVWLLVRTAMLTKRPELRLTFGAFGLVIAAAGVLIAVNFTSEERDQYLKRQAALAEAGAGAQFITTTWNDWTPEAMQAARDAGKIVVLDFTADWCINCKALKKGVLEVQPVRASLEADDTVTFTVDLTSKAHPGWNLLKELGYAGIPLLAIYPEGGGDPWLSNAYGSGQVMRALRDAGHEPPSDPDTRTASAE